MAKGAARLVAAPRITVRSGAEAVADGVVEYIYPTEYEAAVACPTCESVPISFAKPCSFETREVGVVLKATPAIAKDGEKVSVSVVASLVTGPRWKNLASDEFEPAGKAACEAGPRQTMQVPLFSSRAHVEDSLILPAGETWAWSFGGGEKGEDADKFALVFVTPRLVEP